MDTWILLSLLTGIIAIYYYLFKDLNFFKKHGIIHVPPWPVVGNMGPAFLRQLPIVELVQKVYNLNQDAKYVGFFDVMTPIVMIRDPDLIKTIGVKSFEMFPNHRSFIEEDADPFFGKNLFSLRDDKWRDVRALLSPAFTSSKMKAMFKLMSECAVSFTEFLSKLPADKTDVFDTKDSFTRYTNDVIATCAFGISVDSMKNPKNEFYTYGKEATTFSTLRGLKLYLIRSMPVVTKMLGIRFFSNHINEFFKDIISNTIHIRDTKNIVRPDMLQLMMEARKRESGKELTIVDMTAQAFIFFFAGFDSVATLMCFAAHEIAMNPDAQAKLRSEIDEVLKKTNGELTYDMLNEMQYLDAVINEALRLMPVPFLDRVSAEDFELPPALPGDKPFLLKKGMNVWFPAYGLHRDPKYFEKPNEFHPDRFLDENKKDFNSAAYMPFGIGPRMCIGNRFALLETKVMLFHLLARCELKKCIKTSHPLRMSKSVFSNLPEGGFWLKIQARDNPSTH